MESEIKWTDIKVGCLLVSDNNEFLINDDKKERLPGGRGKYLEPNIPMLVLDIVYLIGQNHMNIFVLTPQGRGRVILRFHDLILWRILN